jgi:hypothetical protein
MTPAVTANLAPIAVTLMGGGCSFFWDWIDPLPGSKPGKAGYLGGILGAAASGIVPNLSLGHIPAIGSDLLAGSFWASHSSSAPYPDLIGASPQKLALVLLGTVLALWNHQRRESAAGGRPGLRFASAIICPPKACSLASG